MLQLEWHPQSSLLKAHLSSATALGTVMPRSPSMPAKRSKPECFTPPNGSDWHMYVVAKSLMLVIPACMPGSKVMCHSRARDLDLGLLTP